MIHKSLNKTEWQKKPFAYQMANIGSEAMRVFYWYERGDKKNMEDAFGRYSELFEVTRAGQKKSPRTRELNCLNEYLSNILSRDYKAEYLTPLKNYFTDFAFLARRK